MTDDSERPIIIRRIKKIKRGGHHGGAWKIAYADFVTAMMAFFLLMWLLGLLNKYQLAGVAEYFKKPLKDAFTHESNQKGKDKNTEKFTEKNQEKNKEKETEKEKPAKIDIKVNKATPSPTNAKEVRDVAKVKKDLEEKLMTDPEMRQYKNQLNFVITADGLKVELRDLEGHPMFTTGKSDFEKYAQTILAWLGKELNNYSNRIAVIGHTDAARYAGSDYSNWELSADRANATRRALVKHGLDQDKIIRVMGMGETQPLDKANGLAASNRRIELLILTDDAMKKMLNQ
jgi:chemotaxis protein MotB